MKLGYHVQAWTPGTLDTVIRANAPILKVMDPNPEPVRGLAARRPDLIVVCRQYFGDGEQAAYLSRGQAGGVDCARRVINTYTELLDIVPHGRLYVESLNEIGLWQDADTYDQFTVGFAEECRRQSVLPATFSFPTGNPPGYRDGSTDDLRAYWQHYLAGLRATQAAGGALALHEYDAPTMRRLEGWLCLRYRRVLDALPDDLKNIPILITECGVDGGVLGAPRDQAGWRGYLEAVAYADELRWYAGELAKDPQVIGATVFTAGNADIWTSFDVTGVWPVADALSAQEEPMPVGNEKMSDTNVWWTSIPEMVAGETWQLRGMASGVGAAAVLMLLGHLPLKPDKSTYWQNFVIPLYLTGDGPIVLDWPVPNVPLDGPITVDWSENSGLEFNLPGIGGQTFERPTVANFSCTLNPAGYATPGPIAATATPRDYVFYAAGTAYDVTQDDRYIQIQQQVNAMGGPTVPQFPISGDLATIFYAAGDGYNHDQRPEWLEVQKLVAAIKQDPR